MSKSPLKVSTSIGNFSLDRRLLGLLILSLVVLAAWTWLRAHPEHNPFAPIDLRDPPGLTTKMKLRGLASDAGACRAALERSEVPFRTLAATGDGPCALTDRTQLTKAPVLPFDPVSTCPVAAGLEFWFDHGLQTAAKEHLGTEVVRLVHLGTNNCRRMNNSKAPTAPWSEHATGNAIDIAAFILKDGREVRVMRDWDDGPRGEFLKAARDAACQSFLTVLSPDYNAQHADHFHLDQGTRWSSVCR